MGFPGGLVVKNPIFAHVRHLRDMGSTLGQKISGGGMASHSTLCLGNPMDVRSLAG